MLDFQRVIPKRFERLTHSLEGCCSIQLSYGTIHLSGGKDKYFFILNKRQRKNYFKNIIERFALNIIICLLRTRNKGYNLKNSFFYILTIALFLSHLTKGEEFFTVNAIHSVSIVDRDSYDIYNDSTINDITPDSIVKRLIAVAPEYNSLIEEYMANLYTKGYVNVKKRNILINFVPFMFKLKKGVNEYITESYSELHYTAPYIFDRKVKAYHGTIDKVKNFNTEMLDYFDINVYSNSIFNVKLISPLSHKAMKYYKYNIDSVHNDEYGKLLYYISYKPKYNSYQLINGQIAVYDNTWKIKEFIFSGRSEYMNYTNKLQMGHDSSFSEEILPLNFNTDMSFGLLGNKFDGSFAVNVDYESIKLKEKEKAVTNATNKKSRFDLTRYYTLRSDTSTYLTTDSSYFAGLRPVPLSNKEREIYEQYYSGKESEDMNVKEKTEVKKSIFWGNVENVFVGSPQIGKVRFSPLLNPFLLSYDGLYGLSYKQKIRYQRNYSKNRSLKILPMIGYNFNYNELYWNIPISFEYLPNKRGSFTLDIGNGNRIYNSEMLDELKEIPDSIFDFNNIRLDYFHDFYVDFFHSIEVLNGLSIDAGISIHRRSSIRKFDFGKLNEQPDEAVNEIDNIRNIYNSIAPQFKISWTPMQYYYMAENRKTNIYSSWPTFSYEYERGIGGILNNSGQHERMEFDMQQTISLGLLQNLYYRFGTGVFTNKKNKYFIAFKNFSRNNLPSGWNDDIGGTFQILDRRWYNSSREYMRAHITYDTPFLMIPYTFKRIPNILNERIYVNILAMNHLNPYIELGYGVGTHIFDFGVFVSNKNGKFHEATIKLTLELFNR